MGRSRLVALVTCLGLAALVAPSETRAAPVSEMVMAPAVESAPSVAVSLELSVVAVGSFAQVQVLDLSTDAVAVRAESAVIEQTTLSLVSPLTATVLSRNRWRSLHAFTFVVALNRRYRV